MPIFKLRQVSISMHNFKKLFFAKESNGTKPIRNLNIIKSIAQPYVFEKARTFKDWWKGFLLMCIKFSQFGCNLRSKFCEIQSVISDKNKPTPYSVIVLVRYVAINETSVFLK